MDQKCEVKQGNDSKTEMTEDRNLRITPISAGPARSEGNGCASPSLKWKVTAMKSITKNNLTFLERTKQASSEHPDRLKHMQNSSDILDRVIAKRIIQNAIGGN